MKHYFRHFKDSLRFNLAFLLTLGVLCALAQIAVLLVQNRLSPEQFPHLTFFLFDHTLTVACGAALVLGGFFSILFGIRNKPIFKPSFLVLQETIFVFVLVSAMVIVKEYNSTILSGPAAYGVFYIASWAQGNWMILGLALLLALGFVLLGNKFNRSSKIFSLRLAVALLFLLLLSKGILWASEAKLQSRLIRRDAPNVVLLTIDTLRADHLSSYGYERNTTPFLDQLASQSVVFKNTMTAFTQTTPSFASLFTGKQSYAAGMGVAAISDFPSYNLTLAEILKNAGYYTVAFVSNPTLVRYNNYDDGFERYDELWRQNEFSSNSKRPWSYWDKADRVTQAGVQWLERNHKKRFFMWIHYTDPHAPYAAPAPYNGLYVNDEYSHRFDDIPITKIKKQVRLGKHADPDYYIAQYDGETRFTDDQVRIFLEKLDQLGLKENTLLIVTADHGENMNEHGYYFDHGNDAYESVAHVPLMIRFPREIARPSSVDEVVSLTDVLPTILDFTGLPIHSEVQGHSLKQALTSGEWTRPEYAFIESRTQDAIRTNGWKLIQNMGSSSLELYDINQDPRETVNLIGKGLPIEETLKKVLHSWLEKIPGDHFALKNVKNQDLDPETLERLKSLGYVG